MPETGHAQRDRRTVGNDQPARLDHHGCPWVTTASPRVDDRDLESQWPDAAGLDQAIAEAGRRDYRRGIQGQGRVEHGERRARHPRRWPQGLCRVSRALQRRVYLAGRSVRCPPSRRLCSLQLSAAVGGRSVQLAPNAILPRLPGGRPDLQGLWLKSTGGFQGLFIGSLDGTNFAAPAAAAVTDAAGRGAGGGPPAPRYEYTPEAEAEQAGPPEARI